MNASSAVRAVRSVSVMEMTKWWILMPVALWWASIFLVQMLNPWFLQPVFGVTARVIDVPDDIWQEAKWLIAVVLATELGNNGVDVLKTYVEGLKREEAQQHE